MISVEVVTVVALEGTEVAAVAEEGRATPPQAEQTITCEILLRRRS